MDESVGRKAGKRTRTTTSTSALEEDQLGRDSPPPSTLKQEASSSPLLTAEARLSRAIEDLKHLQPPLLTPTPPPGSASDSAIPSPSHTEPASPPDAQLPQRLSKLNTILRLLERIDSSLRKDDDPLAIDQQRIFSLIAFHVYSYLCLYHREVPVRHGDICSNVRSAGAAKSSADAISGQKRRVKSSNAVDNMRFPHDKIMGTWLSEKLWDTIFDCSEFSTFLTECRFKFYKGKVKEMEEVNDSLKDILRQRLTRQLLGVLSALEELGASRNYAPPTHGLEIHCYRQIWKSVTYSVMNAKAKSSLHKAIFFSLDCPPGFKDDAVPQCHRLAKAFELMPLFLSLSQSCKIRMSLCFLSPSMQSLTAVEDDDDGDSETDLGGDDNNIHEGRIESNKVSRVNYLQNMVSKFNEMAKICPCDSCPTAKEARLYAQIIEHVDSSLWLHRTVKSRGSDYGAANVNLRNMDKPYCILSDIQRTQGNDTTTREQYLQEICSLVHAIKSSYLAAIPTREELHYYKLLCQQLNRGFISCAVSFDHDIEAAEKMKQIAIWDDASVSSLRIRLLSLYKMVLDFSCSVKDECASIISVVYRSIMPDADSSKDPLGWFEKNKVRLARKLKESYRGSSRRRAEQLDRAIVILEEISDILLGTLSGLAKAIDEVESLYLQERYGLVAHEVIHACYVIGK